MAAFLILLYALTLPVMEFLIVAFILTLIGITLYGFWEYAIIKEMTAARVERMQSQGVLSSSYYTRNSPPLEDVMAGLPEVMIPGSAAQQISLLREEEAKQARS